MSGKIRLAVCEDEAFYADKLKKYAEKYFSDRDVSAEISVFSDGGSLLEACGNGARFELIFLDVQLGDTDGLEVASKLREYGGAAGASAVVFVTGMEHRAAEGYAVSAFDYVVKSKADDRLDGVLDRFMKSRSAVSLAVSDAGGGVTVIPFDDILWAESRGRGSAVGLRERVVETPLPIGKLAEKLPRDSFAEVHKSVYARISMIKRIGAGTLEMRGGHILPLSRRRRREVMNAVMSAVKGGSE